MLSCISCTIDSIIRKGVKPNGNAKVNLVHREDVVNIVEILIEKGCSEEVYNIVAPIHPTKKELYQKWSNQQGLSGIEFVSNEVPQKTISPQKIIQELNYKFVHPNPLLFWD